MCECVDGWNQVNFILYSHSIVDILCAKKGKGWGKTFCVHQFCILCLTQNDVVHLQMLSTQSIGQGRAQERTQGKSSIQSHFVTLFHFKTMGIHTLEYTERERQPSNNAQGRVYAIMCMCVCMYTKKSRAKRSRTAVAAAYHQPKIVQCSERTKPSQDTCRSWQPPIRRIGNAPNKIFSSKSSGNSLFSGALSLTNFTYRMQQEQQDRKRERERIKLTLCISLYILYCHVYRDPHTHMYQSMDLKILKSLLALYFRMSLSLLLSYRGEDVEEMCVPCRVSCLLLLLSHSPLSFPLPLSTLSSIVCMWNIYNKILRR